ncbi:uncharacterized protein MELLADRAFT_87118 [Melampsora larici-populina 98AG31]|uniref:TM7S3/TM198-like domain-containing protein n=1 Tax=Melampsora larici-populina (strain 98AG31 / pathotype 3-4-7) TaxID=747676 RepID=F4R4K8_MELLP|nr:uncharacterized protein MELLADRAFT_87118 [Melampsora larici-populina 98AG31]EGG12826.1 hypothetical protein MELLADRAFT_87118 [Melampsora larici-populina 98AG31]
MFCLNRYVEGSRSTQFPIVLLLVLLAHSTIAQVVNVTNTPVLNSTQTPTNRATNLTSGIQATPIATNVSQTNQSQLASNVTSGPTSIPSNSTNSTNSANSTFNEREVLPLDTRVTAPFGILGALLIISGTPMAFWGGRNRWSSYFLTGAYVAAIIVMVPILRFGVIEQDPHPNNLVQGMFLLACVVAAVGAGGVSVIFWKGTRYLVGAGGGFVIALFILSLRENVLIRPPGLRWVMIIGSVTIGFVLATIPAIQLYVTVVATAAMGAAAVMLGVDCFTTAGVKEYWVYIVGFGQMFPKLDGHFPLTITMQAELGVMAGLFVMGAAVQWRLLEVIYKKIGVLKQLDRERAMVEEAAAYRQSMALDADLAIWEKRYNKNYSSSDAADSTSHANSPTLDHHTRKSSQFSLLPRLSKQTSPNEKAGDSQPSTPQAFNHSAKAHLLPGIDSGRGIRDSLGYEAEPLSPQVGDHLLSRTLQNSPVHQAHHIAQRETLAVIEDKMRTLEEVRQMRVSVEKLRAELASSSGSTEDQSPSPGPFNTNSLPIPTTTPTRAQIGEPSWKNSTGIDHSPNRYLRNPERLSSDPRPQSMSVAIDFDKFSSERRVARPPGAPTSWTKRMTMVDLREPSDRAGRPLPLENQERLRRISQGPTRLITVGEPAIVEKKVSPQRQSTVMTIEELDHRHKEAIRKLQGPTTESMTIKQTVESQTKSKRDRSSSHHMQQGGSGEGFNRYAPRPQHQRASTYTFDDRRNSAFVSQPSPLATPSAQKKDKASWLDY